MSTSAPWTLRNECKCGHHQDTHHQGQHNCLGVFCECVRFRKPGEPDEQEEKMPDTERSPEAETGTFSLWPSIWP